LVDVTLQHGDLTAVSEANFGVARGEVVALVGPNGAGKTTLMEAIQGYLRPSAGKVRVFGQNPATSRANIAGRWGVMPQNGGLPMGLTVGECVALFAELHGCSVEPSEILNLTGLAGLAKRRWRRLSGGEQQRLSLAIALCGGQDLMLLDEPTAAVDSAGRDLVLNLITQRAANGTSVLLTTHRFDDVERVASRVVMINQGRIVCNQSVDSLTVDTEHIRFTAPAELDTRRLAELVGPVTEKSPGRFEVTVAPEPANLAAVVSWLAGEGVAPELVTAGRTSLEARFRELTGGAG